MCIITTGKATCKTSTETVTCIIAIETATYPQKLSRYISCFQFCYISDMCSHQENKFIISKGKSLEEKTTTGKYRRK